MDKVVWDILSLNPMALPLLEKNLDKVSWALLCMNPCAGPLFQHHPDKAHTYREYLSFNLSIFEVDPVETHRKAMSFVETFCPHVVECLGPRKRRNHGRPNILAD
jgi:hypothetical protein